MADISALPYYTQTIIIIHDDLIEIFYTLEKIFIGLLYMHRAYIIHFTVINLLAIL